MHEILLTLFLLAPIVPRNPVAQDTVSNAAIHLTAGIRPGTNLVRSGPEIGFKLEYLLKHPIIISAAFDINHAGIGNIRLPSGSKQSEDLALEVMIYRGRKRLTAFLGGGVVYSFNQFHLDKQINDLDLDTMKIADTEIENCFGYRFFVGIRWREFWSFEAGYQESRPDFSFRTDGPHNSYATYYKASDQSTIRIVIGRLVPF